MQNTYIVAVSGGVDSIVLLDALANNRLSELTTNHYPLNTKNLVVAHFDHGIREDSSTDENFTRGVAGEYGLQYESERVELGAGASEEAARQARYNFLRRCCKKYNAQLVTAHHQDDLLETMVINLIRGTGWRGLAPMVQISNHKSQITNNDQTSNIPTSPRLRWAGKDQILRPLLNVSKSKILEYAAKHDLKWREDSTNADQDYLRNYVRLTLLPQIYKKDPEAKNKLLAINTKLSELKIEIATELQKITTHYPLTTNHCSIPRYDLIMWSPIVAQEVVYSILTQLDPDWHPNSLQIKRAVHFVKTAQPGKQMEISKHLKVQLNKGVAQFKKH